MNHDETKLADGRVLLALKRKRVLDFVWVLTLAIQAGVLLSFAWLGWTERGVGSVSRVRVPLLPSSRARIFRSR